MVGLHFFVSLYIFSCTNSLHDIEIMAFRKLFSTSLVVFNFLTLAFILFLVISKNEIISQYLQAYGLSILISVCIVSLLSYLPCSAEIPTDRNLLKILNRSLFCPEYSNRSWLHIYWFGMMGIVNYLLPRAIFLKRNKIELLNDQKNTHR